MTNLLITGGAGTLGSSIIEFMAADYDRVVVLDNFVTGKRQAVPDRPNVEVVEGSITDERLMAGIFEDLNPGHVIHGAAAYQDPSDWASDIETNVLGSSILAKAAITYSPSHVIYLQTALCYGRPAVTPIPVGARLQPFTSYGISKTAGEQYLLNSGLPVTSLRLANVTGPRLSIGPIPTFYQRIRDGKPCFASETVRDFIDISDFIALLRLALADGALQGPFNVSTGDSTSMAEVYEIVAEHLGLHDRTVEIRPVSTDDVQSSVLDPSETIAAFGWTPRVSGRDSIRNLLAWYDMYGVTDIYSHLQHSWGDAK